MSTYDLEIEQAGGDTTTTAATFVPVRWSAFTLTLRRRAPHSLSVDIPIASHHELDDFVSGREWRLKRNGAHWQTGLMNAASLPGGEDGDLIRLEGWGQAYVLTMTKVFVITFLPPWDADSLIGNHLDNTDHGSIGDWFPAAGRTLGVAATALKAFTVSGTTRLALINEAADLEGWEWRPGIDSAGAWTFKASGTVAQNLTGTVRLFSPGNCRITAHHADSSRLVTAGEIASRVPGAITRLNGAHSAGTATLTLDSTNGMRSGMVLIIGEGTAAEEQKTVSDVSSATSLSLTANLTGNHSDNDIVRTKDANTLLQTSANTVDVTTLQQRHHARNLMLFDDQLTDDTRRTNLLTTMLDAYDHVLHTATVVIVNQEDIKRYIDASLAPGDTVKLTSAGKLSAVYDDTTVTVQEMTLAVGPESEVLTLQVGDPALDALTVVEARLRTPLMAATAVDGG